MVGTIGYQLAKNRKIVAWGAPRTHHRRLYHHVRGTGVTRKVVGSVVGSLAHALTNKLTHAISGTGRQHYHRRVHHAGSYRITGTSGYRHRVHHRKPRLNLLSSLLGHGYRKRRVGRPRTTRSRTHTVGGYRVARRVRAPRRDPYSKSLS